MDRVEPQLRSTFAFVSAQNKLKSLLIMELDKYLHKRQRDLTHLY